MYFFIGSDDFKIKTLIIKLVYEWNNKTENLIGRPAIQKLCYFAEAIDVPMGYKFSVYKYGPYSQDLFDHIDDMVVYGLLTDDSKKKNNKESVSSYSITDVAEELLISYKDFVSTYDDKLCYIVDYFKDMSLRDLELFSSIHYYHTANNGYYRGIDKNKLKELTINNIIKAKKDRFKQNEIDSAYFQLEGASLAFS